MTNKNIKLLKNSLFLIKLNNREIKTSFYGKEQGHNRKMRLYLNF